MGFPTSECRSPEEHTSEFVCAVCLQLPDFNEAILTSCNHVFCKSCLLDWFQALNKQDIDTQTCPKCKTNVKVSGVQLLSLASPLSNRVFGRIRVRCPLSTESCSWVGDYSDLQSHLTNTTEHTGGLNSDAVKRTAILLKEQANDKFVNRNYVDAIRIYTKAINVCPDLLPELYSNRAYVYLITHEYEKCVMDCRKTIQIDPKFVKAYVRATKALTELGRFDEALKFIDQGIDAVKPAKDFNLTKQQRLSFMLVEDFERAKELSNQGRHSEARTAFSKLLQETSAKQIMVYAAQEEIHASNIERALRLTLQVLRVDPQNVHALVVRATAMYHQGDFKDALTVVKHALRLFPDSKDAKALFHGIKNLNKLMEGTKKNVYDESVVVCCRILQDKDPRVFLQNNHWNDNLEKKMESLRDLQLPKIVQTSPLAIDMHAERANALFRLRLYPKCLEDCSHAIYYKEDCKRAWLTKSYALLEMGDPERARKELAPVMERWGQGDSVVKGVWEKVEFECRRKNRPDYYELLSVSKLASEPEIKAAYKQQALVFHPDRLAPDASAEEKAAAEARFKLLGEALEVFSDQFKKQLYDEGYDKQAIEERVQRAQQAAHRH